MEPRWGDNPEAPWWAKLRRAKSHISEVRQQVHALQVAEPWSVQRELARMAGHTGSGSTSQFRRIWQQPQGMRWPICAPRSTTSPTSWPSTTQER